MITKLAKRPRSQKIDERFGLPANNVRIKAVILSWGRSECCALDPLIDKTAPVNCVKQGKSLRFGAFGSRRWRKSVAIVPLRAAKIHFRKFRERSRNIFAINEKFSHFATMRGDSGTLDSNWCSLVKEFSRSLIHFLLITLPQLNPFDRYLISYYYYLEKKIHT